jgi:hypothetical protein
MREPQDPSFSSLSLSLSHTHMHLILPPPFSPPSLPHPPSSPTTPRQVLDSLQITDMQSKLLQWSTALVWADQYHVDTELQVTILTILTSIERGAFEVRRVGDFS